MFKISQEIQISGDTHTRAKNIKDTNSIFGKYQKKPDADLYPVQPQQVFVAPELTDPSKVQLIHFPSGAVRINSQVSFILRRNGVKGNFEVKLESPTACTVNVPLQILDPERLEVQFCLDQAGLYKIHIKCNSVLLPKSPFIIVSICGVTVMSENK